MMARFGEVLAELRSDRKLTQKALADILHVTVGTISNYENGVHFPDVEKLTDLADYFQVTTDYLLGRCTYSISPNIFEETLLNGKTVGDIITILRHLSPERRQAISVILSDMEYLRALKAIQ